MWLNGRAILCCSIHLSIIISYAVCGYIGGPNQRTSPGRAYHSNRGYIHTGSKLEPPSRPSFNWDDPQFRPYFDDVHSLNVTSQLGKTAYLQCAIKQLGDRTVSWVRQRDLHILTVGSYTYTSDQRFSCIHREDTGTWTLEIKYVRKEDQGVYECQISTEPKLSFSVRLIVQATKAIIPEGPLIQLAPKSQLKLTCLLEANYQTRKSRPSFVFWYKDGAVINYLTGRAELRVISNFIDGHHFYNRSSDSSFNSQFASHQDSPNPHLASSNFNSHHHHHHHLHLSSRSHSHSQQPDSFSSSTHHQSSPYLAANHNGKFSQPSSRSSAYYDHPAEPRSPVDFHSSYGGHLNTNEDDENGGGALDYELYEREDSTRNKEIIVSILTIDGVRTSDSGEYACKPSYAEFANCTVQVLKDETIRGGPIYGQQANNIYASGNYRDEEEPRSIEFMDEEESFYIIGRRSPEHNLPNTSNSLKLASLNLIWISLFAGAILYSENSFL